MSVSIRLERSDKQGLILHTRSDSWRRIASTFTSCLVTECWIRDMKNENQTKRQLLNVIEKLQNRIIEQESTFENKLKSTEENLKKYQFLVNTSAHSTTLISRNYVYEAVNTSYCKAIGKSPDEIIGRTISEIWGQELFAERIKAHFDKCFKWNTVERFYDIVQFPLLGRRFFEISYYPYSDQSGEITHAVVVSRDLSEWKKIEEELIRNDKLESLGSLAADIANSFNNILTSIIGNIDRAKKTNQSGKEISCLLNKVGQDCQRAKNLTFRLLTFSGVGEPLKKITTFDESLADVIQFSLIGSDIQFNLTIACDLYPVEIDVGLINKAIGNIIQNAEQSMPEGGAMHFSVENQSVTEPNPHAVKGGEYVLLKIRDEGVGISEKHLKSIFNPYFTTKQKGRGLGLSTAYSIIRTHFGYITAESVLDFGTTISIYLPAVLKNIGRDRAAAETGYNAIGNILVMDGDSSVRELARGVLTDIGYSVETAINGEEALELFEKANQSSKPFDVVILDLAVSQGMECNEILTKLKHIDRDIKTIVSSGYTNDPVLSSYKQHGFCAALPKPYEIEELYDLVYDTMHW